MEHAPSRRSSTKSHFANWPKHIPILTSTWHSLTPLDADGWEGKTGLIHEVVLAQYVKDHPNPKAVEYYLCGPPALITACTAMLTDLGVSDEQIVFDEF